MKKVWMVNGGIKDEKCVDGRWWDIHYFKLAKFSKTAGENHSLAELTWTPGQAEAERMAGCFWTMVTTLADGNRDLSST